MARRIDHPKAATWTGAIALAAAIWFVLAITIGVL